MEKGQTTWPENILLVSGDRYEGEWRDGTENGQGTFIWSDGDSYGGEWKKWEPNGVGTYTLSDGRKYEGEFKDGKQNGQGILTLLEASRWRCDWRDNKPWNIIEFDNEQHIIGMWLNGIEE